ncbi:hypothetical protein EDM80_07205 [bacterium]|nr:MAG: hypothetical protein EDM80_07205 [bacterium]RIK65406.1 MAG: hypothetical protein DCC64_01855 [Planctomycetota bacterium]
MVNSLAFDWLSGSEADDLDLTGAGKKKKKKKKRGPAAPQAPVAGYDAATGQPIYDEVIGYDTRTGKPLYAQQEARRRAALAQAGGQQIVGYDDLGQPLYGPAQTPASYPMQPGFAPVQPGLAAVGQGSMFGAFADVGAPAAYPAYPGTPTPPPPPGVHPQLWAQYLAAQQAAQNAQLAPQGQGAPFFSLVGDPAAPQAPVDFESAGGSFYSGDESGGASFLDQGDFDNLQGGGGYPPLPMFRALGGSGCCHCAGFKKYPPRDAIADPF